MVLQYVEKRMMTCLVILIQYISVTKWQWSDRWWKCSSI